MSRTVVFRAEARYEFDEAALWYEERRIGLGAEFVVEIGRAIDLAREHPQRLPLVYSLPFIPAAPAEDATAPISVVKLLEKS